MKKKWMYEGCGTFQLNGTSCWHDKTIGYFTLQRIQTSVSPLVNGGFLVVISPTEYFFY
ncbi:MAG: hypothetical protein OEY56_10900 [Cyclobacteriaceae bacterium]|nr:hypothetical protein [Cyclobacteriaceae bacterium]